MTNWIKEGHLTLAADGTFSLAALFAAGVAAAMADKRNQVNTATGTDAAAGLARYRLAHARREELKLAKERGKLIAAGDAAAIMGRMAIELRSQLDWLVRSGASVVRPDDPELGRGLLADLVEPMAEAIVGERIPLTAAAKKIVNKAIDGVKAMGAKAWKKI